VNIRRHYLGTRIAGIAVLVIALSLLFGTWGVSADELSIEGLLKQMSLVSAHVKDFECILESVCSFRKKP
jgi:hypothetical protein